MYPPLPKQCKYIASKCLQGKGIISSLPIFIFLYSCHESILITSMELKVMQVIAISNLRAIKANKPLLWNTLLSGDQQKTCKNRVQCKFKPFLQLSWSENVITLHIRGVQIFDPAPGSKPMVNRSTHQKTGAWMKVYITEEWGPHTAVSLRTLEAWGYTPPNTINPARKLEDSYLGKQNTAREKEL